MKTKCVHCGQDYDVEQADLGSLANCEKCGNDFTVQQAKAVLKKPAGGFLRKALKLLGIIFLLMFIFGACSAMMNLSKTPVDAGTGLKSESSATPAIPATPTRRNFELLDEFTAKRTQFGIEITGTVENTTNLTGKYVQIIFGLYDKSGAQVDTAMTNTLGLEPHGKWKFKVHTMTEFDTFKLIELKGRL